MTPAIDIKQACGTGLEAAIVVANKIALGQIEVGMAGGGAIGNHRDRLAGGMANEQQRRILHQTAQTRCNRKDCAFGHDDPLARTGEAGARQNRFPLYQFNRREPPAASICLART